ncbi:MAG: LysM peptidoglycan-binding domain-containing protein [Gammaproteobacteria bacterium]|nr:LysM peptidoglycan-binding domain-containing protein [Gammaproteobacteria bacterium]MDH4254891.1 LysM peptidoglycan-binding domain-containing protein [Gammaproteobacteria bacterium]MDH5310527.1 LysM peptidoglycan-binding domain-containing protein [Gammaproteobacteria bacterium]
MFDKNPTAVHTLDARRLPLAALAATLAVAIGGPPGFSGEARADALPSLGASLSIGTSHARPVPPEDRLWLTLEDYQEVPALPGTAWNDLLEQLRRNFELDSVMNARVQAELDWFLKHPEYLDRVFTRAQRYLPYIVAELERRKLPMELALLPIVESAFDPFAYSHGRAAGLWQLIPGTARRFGVRQNWWYDGRRDVVDSTRAALDYLAALHELMEGDWLLAVASYNSGEGNVLRAVKSNRKAGKPADFWNLRLSKETSAYVPRLMALVEIVREPEAHGITLPSLVDEPQFVAVEIEGQVDLALAAELAGLDLDTLSAYNAGVNRWATDPGGPHRLILPAGHDEGFALALAEIPPNERVRWQRHKVRNGETLSEIADKYHTTIAEVKAANNIRGNIIRAGDHLMIPMASKPLTAYSKSADARREQIQNRERAGNRVEHTVAAGESFWSIGQRYGVGTRDLAAWNGMAPRDTLSIGQTLVVWTDRMPPSTAPTSMNLTRKLNYTVRQGDSLYLIASRFRISVTDLVRWNNIDKDKILRPGQRLTMYVDVAQQSS